MTVRTTAGAVTGEDASDLTPFLQGLTGAPEVHEVVVLACAQHGDDRPTWMYVEADAASGLARRRCLVCATGVPLRDSDERWTYPPTWACPGCRQSIAELAVGLHVPDGEHVEWLALAARCVDCGRLAGLTDQVVPREPVDEVRGRL